MSAIGNNLISTPHGYDDKIIKSESVDGRNNRETESRYSGVPPPRPITMLVTSLGRGHKLTNIVMGGGGGGKRKRDANQITSSLVTQYLADVLLAMYMEEKGYVNMNQ